MDDLYQDVPSVPIDDVSVSLNGNGGATALTSSGSLCIGRVGAPPQKEATSTNFFFWLPPDTLVETTQLIYLYEHTRRCSVYLPCHCERGVSAKSQAFDGG